MNAKVKGTLMLAGGITTGILSFKPILKRFGYSSRKLVKDSPIEDVTPIDEAVIGDAEVDD